MAKPLKPFVRGGYYPSSRWTPLVYPGGYTTANGAMPLINTVKGAIAHVTDAIAMPVIGLKCEINPLQAGTGDPSPTNVRPITGLTGCKLHHTGVSLIGGDAFIGNTFSKTANGYQLSYNGSGVANRASGYADISGIPEGRYVLQFLNCSYPEGIEVAFRRRTDGTLTSVGTIIGSSTSGTRTFDVPANTTALQFYIIPNSTVAVGDKVTMDDAILYRIGETAEPYKGNTYDIAFPSEAGTVYGGTLDVVNKKLTVTNKRVLLADLTWSKAGGNTIFRCSEITDAEYGNYFGTRILCSNYNPYVGAYASLPDGAIALNNRGYSNTPYLIIKDNAKISGTIEDFVASLANQTIIYPLASPIVYDLTDIPEMTMLLGTNNIWHDANGDTELTYYAE